MSRLQPMAGTRRKWPRRPAFVKLLFGSFLAILSYTDASTFRRQHMETALMPLNKIQIAKIDEMIGDNAKRLAIINE